MDGAKGAMRVAPILGALALSASLAACGAGEPAESPEVVTKRFYDLISASKAEGGTTPASEAYKLTTGPQVNLHPNQFVEIVKNYPPDFKVEVGKAEVKGNQALVAISFKMPSSFGGDYEVKQQQPLVLDKASNTWKVDFTGDTYGMQKDDAIAASKGAAPGAQEGK